MRNTIAGRMLTLDEHNRQKQLAEQALWKHGAGVACPSCGTEMVFTHPGAINTTPPSPENVRCPRCGRTGLKF